MLPVAPVPLPADEMDDQTEEAVTACVTDTVGSSAGVTTTVLRGSPAGALLQTVTPDSVLVLGSRGRGGFKGLLLGSVSQECVEYAACPVVVVRTERTIGDRDVISDTVVAVGVVEPEGQTDRLVSLATLAVDRATAT